MSWTIEEFEEKVKKGQIAPIESPHDGVARNLFDDMKNDISPEQYVHKHGSGPEFIFARDYLEERVESGTSLGWAFEPLSIRMVGQTYTPDFIEWCADGVTRFYEVKGAKKIPSQDRSSAKYRTTAALFESDMIQFYWAKQKKDGSFKPRKLPKQGKRDKHSFLRE